MAAAEEPSAEPFAPLEVPARSIPVPSSVSIEARSVLGALATFAGDSLATYPPLDDTHAWREFAAVADDLMLPLLAARVSELDITIEEREVEGVRVFVAVPNMRAQGSTTRVCLDVHGGALFSGGGAACEAMTAMMADRLGVTTWGVDYRMPPDHPYPAPLDDCFTVYRALLKEHQPEDVVVSGVSAGGNLAAAMLLRARDEGLPLPSATVLVSPECDLTESGDSFATNLGVDTVLTQPLLPANLLYANGHDLADPYLSPLFGDFTKGFPPTMLQAGTRDLFLSNAVRLHRRLRAAGIDAELHVFEAMPHGGFFGAPEDRELDAEMRAFVDAHWTGTG